ncbi:hypothetical protein [Streptomyces goshikiensis]|uniref:hypothetical protein n=1 Tax=Streptomyces goshikiensis TaxID=1942 RepID=UPI0033AF99B3
MTARYWNDLPASLRDRLTHDLATTGVPLPVTGGYTSGVRVRIDTARGPVFVKAIPADDPAAEMYRTEMAAVRTLPAGIGPALLTAAESHGWIALAFDYVAGRHPDLAPGSPDLHTLTETLTHAHAALTPCPLPSAPPLADSPIFSGRPLPEEYGHGDTLLHCDLRADNLLVTPDGTITLLDWAWPYRGPAWAEFALLVPQLILTGHTPANAERWAAQAPAYRGAPPAGIDAIAEALTDYWTSRTQQGTPELRAYRTRAAEAGRAWVQHRQANSTP